MVPTCDGMFNATTGLRLEMVKSKLHKVHALTMANNMPLFAIVARCISFGLKGCSDKQSWCLVEGCFIYISVLKITIIIIYNKLL